MVRAFILVLLLALPFMAAGQDVVKVNILEIAGKIPAPPRDVKDAFSRTVEIKEQGVVNARRETGPFYKPVSDQLETANQKIEKAIEVLSKPQMDAAKQMDQKEMQKKFKSMSKEEQIKMAMEMGKTMGLGPKVMVRESNDVMSAQEECLRINQEISNDIQTAQTVYEAREKLTRDREAKHAEIEAWRLEQAKKLPQVNYGEMGGPEPKAEYALLTKVMEKHLAAENEYLKAVQKEWNTTWGKYRARYAPLQEKLLKINHGEDARNSETKRQLVGGQGQMVSGTGDLIALSRKATEGAAEWWQRKLDLEKNKPKD